MLLLLQDCMPCTGSNTSCQHPGRMDIDEYTAQLAQL